MKFTLLAGALALGLLTAGCTGCSLLNSPASLAETQVDEKALYGVEAADYGANLAAEAAVDTGLLIRNSPQALKVKDILGKAHQATIAARAAYTLGNTAGLTQQIAAAQGFIADAWPLIPKKGA